ncbi:MAG: hypothetical protein FJY95_05910 [Candidatus Handelsmanbacteria bacterium]|nr:hypothetical protein [Candidatus Handelsmanbacteria bacterium]
MVWRQLLCGALLILWGCAEKPAISVQVFPGVLAPSPADPTPAGWERVEFGGSLRAAAGVYYVRGDTLLTEWNIIASRPVSPPEGGVGAAVRLNAYAVARMQKYTADEANLRTFLAVRINGRWADFIPVLDRINDRMMLFGFSEQEVKDLDQYLAKR